MNSRSGAARPSLETVAEARACPGRPSRTCSTRRTWSEPETRARVIAVIAETGYRPVTAAQHAADPALAPDRGRYPGARRTGQGDRARRLPARAHPPGAERRGYRVLLSRGRGRRAGDRCVRRPARRLRPGRVRAHRHPSGRTGAPRGSPNAASPSSPSAGLGRRGRARLGGRRRRLGDRRATQHLIAPRPPADRASSAGREGSRCGEDRRTGWQQACAGGGPARPSGLTARPGSTAWPPAGRPAPSCWPRRPAHRLRVRQRHDRARSVDRDHRARPDPRPGRRRDRLRRLHRGRRDRPDQRRPAGRPRSPTPAWTCSPAPSRATPARPGNCCSNRRWSSGPRS